MCKLMIMPGITNETQENAWKLIKEMAKKMSTGGEKDGLGYSAIDSEGKMFGERWHINDQAFDKRESLNPVEEEIINSFNGILNKDVKYNNFGELNYEGLRSITMHTRLATSGKEFYNTHPFVLDDTSLIHNGVIFNTSKLTMLQSTCDSETILNLYVEHNVMNKPKNIQKVVDELDGYFACAVFSKTEDGTPILDIFKDNRAQLNAVFIKELNTIVFSTALGHIKEACEKLSFSITSVFEVADNFMVRMNALTGKVIGTWQIKAKDNVKIHSSHKGDIVVKEKSTSSLPSSTSARAYGVGTGSVGRTCRTLTDTDERFNRNLTMLTGKDNNEDWEYDRGVWRKKANTI